MKTKLDFKTLTAQFNWVNSEIEKSFPLTDVRGDEYKLFHFDQYISSEDAVTEIEKEGYSPATLSELLMWQGWNKKDWVVALGQSAQVGGVRRVPEIWRDFGFLRLVLNYWGDDWSSGHRFLAVRTQSLEPNALDPLNLALRVEKLEQIIKHHNL